LHLDIAIYMPEKIGAMVTLNPQRLRRHVMLNDVLSLARMKLCYFFGLICGLPFPVPPTTVTIELILPKPASRVVKFTPRTPLDFKRFV
jgi:hypothetical protein